MYPFSRDPSFFDFLNSFLSWSNSLSWLITGWKQWSERQLEQAYPREITWLWQMQVLDIFTWSREAAVGIRKTFLRAEGEGRKLLISSKNNIDPLYFGSYQLPGNSLNTPFVCWEAWIRRYGVLVSAFFEFSFSLNSWRVSLRIIASIVI